MSNIWRHKKTGDLYTVVDDNFTIEKTMEQGVLYQNLGNHRKWVRPYEEFHDGRFEKFSESEYPDVEGVDSTDVR